jgi:hypothetical protein
MGREARRKRTGTPYRVRTGDEVRAKFLPQLEAVFEEMEAANAERGYPSFAERETKQTLEVHPDGSRTMKLDQLTMRWFRLQKAAFEYKFGRPMGPGDTLLFQFDANTPTPVSKGYGHHPEAGELTHEELLLDVREAARKVGADPDAVVEHLFGTEALDDFLDKH